MQADGLTTPARPTAGRTSSYAAAFDATAEAIRRRAANYRRLATAVAAIVLLAPTAAAVGRSWRPLTGWLLLLPCTAVALAIDAALVARWRRGILAARDAGDVDLAIFRTAMRANRALPSDTLDAMLATLPEGATIGDVADHHPC